MNPDFLLNFLTAITVLGILEVSEELETDFSFKSSTTTGRGTTVMIFNTSTVIT